MTTPATTPPAGSTMPRATVRCSFCLTWNRIDASRVAQRPKCGECGRPLLLDRPVKLDADSFARTIQETEVPVLVDFYADWCGPCKMMAPVLDQLAADRQGSLLVGKLDTDANQAIAQQFSIRGIPTVILFEGGQEARRQSGAMPMPALQAFVKG